MLVAAAEEEVALREDEELAEALALEAREDTDAEAEDETELTEELRLALMLDRLLEAEALAELAELLADALYDAPDTGKPAEKFTKSPELA